MLACDDNTSIDCARVMRGAASSAKAVSPCVAMAEMFSASNGLSMPTTTVPAFISVRSSGDGALTFRTISAAKASAALAMVAPATV